jgi:hypothetical protein
MPSKNIIIETVSTRKSISTSVAIYIVGYAMSFASFDSAIELVVLVSKSPFLSSCGTSRKTGRSPPFPHKTVLMVQDHLVHATSIPSPQHWILFDLKLEPQIIDTSCTRTVSLPVCYDSVRQIGAQPTHKYLSMCRPVYEPLP